MLIHMGRLLMILVWAFLLLNIIQPFPKPLKYFIDVALFFTLIMHGLQVALFSTTQPKDQPLLRKDKWGIFFFGVFHLLALNKKMLANSNKK